MRRLIYPVLILLPVLAHAQAKTQTSTLTAAQSTASVATLEAKANPPHALHAVTAPAAATSAADPGTQIMVPVHQTVVERYNGDADSTDSTLSYSFGAVITTAPKLVQASPLTMSLRDMESETSEAAVVLQFMVDLTGATKDVKVLHSGGAMLDKRAIEAINLYRFKPATQNNVPVEAPVTVEIKIKKS